MWNWFHQIHLQIVHTLYIYTGQKSGRLSIEAFKFHCSRWMLKDACINSGLFINLNRLGFLQLLHTRTQWTEPFNILRREYFIEFKVVTTSQRIHGWEVCYVLFIAICIQFHFSTQTAVHSNCYSFNATLYYAYNLWYNGIRIIALFLKYKK